MSAFHLGPIQACDAIAVAEAFGFDPVDFLRVIGPLDCYYREQVTARINK